MLNCYTLFTFYFFLLKLPSAIFGEVKVLEISGKTDNFNVEFTTDNHNKTPKNNHSVAVIIPHPISVKISRLDVTGQPSRQPWTSAETSY